MNKNPQVFISYIKENESYVQRLAEVLQTFGIKVWIDKKDLMPGYRWKDAIRKGIAEGDFFIACFSSEYATRNKTYMNEELILAIDELRHRPINRAWFIPVLLSKCDIPEYNIGAGETLRSIQWIELHSINWHEGVKRILSVIHPESGKIYELIQQLRDQSARVRIRAADELGKMGELAKEAFIPLMFAADDSNDTVCAAAVEALGKIGGSTEDLTLKLLYVLKRGEHYSGHHAATLLAKIGKQAIPGLVEASKHPGTVNHFANQALGDISDPEAVSLLIDLLNRNFTSVIRAFGRIGKPAKAAVPHLIKMLTTENQNNQTIYDVIDALGCIGDSAALPQLITKLPDDNFIIRMYTVKALGKIGDALSVQPLIEMLDDLVVSVRSAVVEALYSIATPEALDAAYRHVQCVTLIKEISKKSDPANVPALIDALNRGHYDAIKGVGLIGRQAKAAVSSLIDILLNQELSIGIRCEAAEALGKIGDADAVPALINTFDVNVPYSRPILIKALEEIGTPEALNAVKAVEAGNPFRHS